MRDRAVRAPTEKKLLNMSTFSQKLAPEARRERSLLLN